MGANRVRLSFLLVSFVVLAGVIHASQVKLRSILDKGDPLAQEQLIPDGKVVKLLSGGYQQLIADFWWLAFIQYYGDDEARKKDNYKRAYDFLDLVTTLDPGFTQPYWFAAFAVGAEQKRPDLAAELIERGLEAHQDNWYLPFIAGINQYLFAGEYKEAARYYKLASTYPEAPAWLAGQALILEAEIPPIIKTARVWQGIYESSEDPLVRERAREKLVRLWTEILERSPSEKIRMKATEQLQYLNAGD